MRPEARLRRTADFARVRQTGRSWGHPLVTLTAAAGPDLAAPTRLGLTASRKVGGSVVRNRLRRRVREAVRRRYAQLPAGWDLIFTLRAAAAEADSQAIIQAVESLLKRAGLLAA